MFWVFLATLGVMLVVMGIMAVGVMAGREPIKGSCGGIGALGINQSCDICGGNPQRCESETRDSTGSAGASTPFYNADS
jgi:hypothetical protein